MGWFTSLKIETLRDLFIHQLQDLYDTENRLIDALQKMVDAATWPDLRSAFQNHLRETETHVTRLETIFSQLGEDPERTTCQAIKGLLAEGEEILEAEGDSAVKDAALIAAAQRVEHYEIAGYGTARAFAGRLGFTEIAGILTETLEEEGNADKLLTSIAEESVNPATMRTEEPARSTRR